MTLPSIVENILLSVLSSFVFWLLTFVISGTKVIFADKIEKSVIEKQESGSPLYRVRIMNVGKRDLMEVSYTAKVSIQANNRKRTTYFCLGEEQTVPILKGWSKAKMKKSLQDNLKKPNVNNPKNANPFTSFILGFYTSDVAVHEFSKPYYSETIREKARHNTLTLDDVLSEYGSSLSIELFVTGNDRLTGARKTFVSKEYKAEDIREGLYRRFDGVPKGFSAYFPNVKCIKEKIARIDSVEDIYRETSVDMPERLNASNDKDAKAEFLSRDKLVRPANLYGNIHIEDIESKIRLLENFISGLRQVDPLPFELATDIQCFRFNLKKLYFIKANYEYHNDPRSRAQAEEKHRELNRQLYGIPNRGIFHAILREKGIAVDGSLECAEIFRPQEQVRARFNAIIQKELEGILSYIPEGRESFSPQEACTIINRILECELDAKHLQWRAEVDPNVSIASVNQISRKVIIPGNRSKGNYSRADLRAIIAHEIGVHVRRALPANKLGSCALSYGLPYYEAFEEGLAKAVENAVSKADRPFEHPGYRHYVSIGYAYFYGMNFRDVFQKQLEIWGDTEENRKIAFDSVQRAFRGTGELLNSKDLVYYTGSDLVWKYIEEHIEDPDLMTELFGLGKIDVTQNEHRAIAEAIMCGSKA